jgi:hypothetical protein
LGFPDFNKELIDAFKDKVASLKLDPNINLTDEEIVALLLNTPASFDLIKGNFATMRYAFQPSPTVINPEKVATLFMTYAKQAHLTYEEAVIYANQLMQHMKFAGLKDFAQYTKDGFALTMMNFLMKEYAQVLNANSSILPEIQVLVAIGASNIISRVISYDSCVNEPWAYLYAQLVQRLRAKPEAIQIAVCNSLAWLLMQAIQNNNHQRIETILNGIFYVVVHDQTFADCFSAKLKGELGKSLVNYLMQSDANVAPFQSSLWPNFIQILWNHAINSPQITAQKLTRLLASFNLNIGFNARPPTKLSFAWPIDALIKQAADVKKMKNQFLMDLMRQGFADETNLALLINQNADYNLADAQGVTVLMHAIKKGWVRFVRMLLELPDINKNACDKQGHNALWYARNLETDAGTRLAIIELLQHAGATEEGPCVIQ